MSIVDAHTHVVSRDLHRYPLAPAAAADQPWHLDRPVEADALLQRAAEAGVDAVAFVQAISAHGYDNRYVLERAAANPGRSIAVVAVDVTAPGAPSSLRAMAGSAPVHGVRLFTPEGPTASLDAPAIVALASTAGALDIPVVVLALAPQLPSVRRLAATRPDVTIVLDHCGFADLGGDGGLSPADELLALADQANVVLKVSSITLRSTAWPEALWVQLVARFGAERIVWGTDFPHTDGPGYGALVDLARTTTAALSPADRDAVLGGTARRIWPSLASAPA